MSPEEIRRILDLMGDKHMSTTDILHELMDTSEMGYNDYRREEARILHRMIYLTTHGYTVRIESGQSNKPSIWAVA